MCFSPTTTKDNMSLRTYRLSLRCELELPTLMFYPELQQWKVSILLIGNRCHMISQSCLLGVVCCSHLGIIIFECQTFSYILYDHNYVSRKFCRSTCFPLVAVRQGKGHKLKHSHLTIEAIKIAYILNLILSKHVGLAPFYIKKKI